MNLADCVPKYDNNTCSLDIAFHLKLQLQPNYSYMSVFLPFTITAVHCIYVIATFNITYETSVSFFCTCM